MKDKFTKADLRDGMVVEQRNEERYLVIGNRVLNLRGFNKLSQYENNLTESENGEEYDIVKVFKVKNDCVYSLKTIFADSVLELIWERTESKKMTTEEMRQKLEELTGEKIEVEPSREEMIGTIKMYCDNCTDCDKCCHIKKECRDKEVPFGKCDKETIKKCYKKVTKDE